LTNAPALASDPMGRNRAGGRSGAWQRRWRRRRTGTHLLKSSGPGGNVAVVTPPSLSVTAGARLRLESQREQAGDLGVLVVVYKRGGRGSPTGASPERTGVDETPSSAAWRCAQAPGRRRRSPIALGKAVTSSRRCPQHLRPARERLSGRRLLRPLSRRLAAGGLIWSERVTSPVLARSDAGESGVVSLIRRSIGEIILLLEGEPAAPQRAEAVRGTGSTRIAAPHPATTHRPARCVRADLSSVKHHLRRRYSWRASVISRDPRK
jgi:hypothetical protein